MTIPIDKATLRKQLMALRAQWDPAAKASADAAIADAVLAWQADAGVHALGVYWPLRGEPELGEAYAALALRGVKLSLPVVLERDAALAFAHWEPGEPMVRDQMGVAVPRALRIVARPPALLVPCLGFNAERYRLGYGGGFYDRTLAPHPRPITVGIAYASLQVAFASAPHDVALDLVLTEYGQHGG